jgi:transcription antitermination protein NusB
VTSRRRARRRAIDLLYQADVTGSGPLEVLRSWRDAEREIPPFTTELVEGVAGSLVEVDAAIGRAAEGWTVQRLAAVDRAILRVAVFELLHRPDVPPAAAIDEAVDAAKELSTEDSGRFVNGVLGAIVRSEARDDGA